MVGISVILTAYKRDYFGEQIKAIKNQTIKPKHIYIWQNGNFVNVDKYRKEGVKLIKSDENFKFHGRFAFALLMKTEYVAIFDDDIIPGVGWLENCLNLSKEKNCIVGQNGRNFDLKTKTKYVCVGPNRNKDYIRIPANGLKFLFGTRCVIGKKPDFYILNNLESVDIDYPIDFEIAEYLYLKYF